MVKIPEIMFNYKKMLWIIIGLTLFYAIIFSTIFLFGDGGEAGWGLLVLIYYSVIFILVSIITILINLAGMYWKIKNKYYFYLIHLLMIGQIGILLFILVQLR